MPNMNQPKDAPKIEFPCERYLIKVIGDASASFAEKVANVLVKYDAKVTADSFKENASSKGRFVSLNIYMRIEKAEHLQQLHEELKQNPAVKMVL